MGLEDSTIDIGVTDEGFPVGMCEDCEVDLLYEEHVALVENVLDHDEATLARLLNP